MDSDFDQNLIGPLVFLASVPIFLVLMKYDLSNQGLFALATTGPMLYILRIESKLSPSLFIRFCLFLIFCFHSASLIFILYLSKVEFLDRSYTATGLGLVYFSILYFFVWVCKRFELWLRNRD